MNIKSDLELLLSQVLNFYAEHGAILRLRPKLFYSDEDRPRYANAILEPQIYDLLIEANFFNCLYISLKFRENLHLGVLEI